MMLGMIERKGCSKAQPCGGEKGVHNAMQQHPFSRAREQGKGWRMVHRGSAQEGAKLGYVTCKVRIWLGWSWQASNVRS